MLGDPVVASVSAGTGASAGLAAGSGVAVARSTISEPGGAQICRSSKLTWTPGSLNVPAKNPISPRRKDSSVTSARNWPLTYTLMRELRAGHAEAVFGGTGVDSRRLAPVGQGEPVGIDVLAQQEESVAGYVKTIELSLS